MKLRMLIFLTCALLAVSACVIEPYGYGGGDHYGGHSEGHHDYGRRVWR